MNQIIYVLMNEIAIEYSVPSEVAVRDYLKFSGTLT